MRRLPLVVAMVVVVGCQQAGNPLQPDTNLPFGTGAGNLPVVVVVYPANRTLLADDDPATPGTQATIVVEFSDFMDEAATPGGVRVLDTRSGQEMQGTVSTYNRDAKVLYIRHDHWFDTTEYLLTLSCDSVRNRWGTTLDGNGNGVPDGRPYDDGLSAFFTQGGSRDSCVPGGPPRLTQVTPDTSRIQETLPAITIAFSADMDTLTLVPDNFSLTDENTQPVPLARPSVGRQWVTLRPQARLSFGHTYTLSLDAAAIRAAPHRNVPSYILLLDSDGDGADSSEPDVETYFLCDTVSCPTVAAQVLGNGLAFDFSLTMDTATLSSTNVRAYDDRGYTPGTIVFRQFTAGGARRVEYYFDRPVAGALRGYVSRAVESVKGRALDGQATPNGIGGEEWDDYWWN